MTERTIHESHPTVQRITLFLERFKGKTTGVSEAWPEEPQNPRTPKGVGTQGRTDRTTQQRSFHEAIIRAMEREPKKPLPDNLRKIVLTTLYIFDTLLVSSKNRKEQK